MEKNNFLSIKKLKGYCEQHIESHINLNNCLRMKELCENHKLGEPLDHCLNFINDNLMKVLELDEFLDLSFKNVELFFTDPATGCDNIPLISLLEVLSKWLAKDTNSRAMDYQKLLLILDWSNCSKELFDHLAKDKLFNDNKLCLYSILNAMDANHIDLDNYKATFIELKKIYGKEEAKNKVGESARSIRSTRRQNAKVNNLNDDIEMNCENKELLSMKTEYCVRGKKHSATLAQWKEGVKCPKCTYIGHSAPRLEQHLAKVHQENTTYTCKYCNFTCKWNREYYKHMKTHFKGPPYNCSECDYTCDRVQFILSHLMRHTDERPFACDQCNFRSRTKGNLVVHYRIHTGEKPYKCQFCEKKFAMKNTLDQHMATHRDDRPYLCDKCGFTTKYQSHLLSHKRIHTGNVFYCEQENCNYFSPRRSQLAAHMRSHLSIRSHVCQTCGRAFIERSHLIRHERIHLDEKPFKCEQCDYGSTRRDKLKEHVLKHHNQNGEKTFKPRKSKKNEATISKAQPQYQFIQQVHFENADQIPEEVQQQIIAHYQNQQINGENVSITIGENVYESQLIVNESELIVTPVNANNQIKNSNGESTSSSQPEIQITNVTDQEVVTDVVEFVLV